METDADATLPTSSAAMSDGSHDIGGVAVVRLVSREGDGIIVRRDAARASGLVSTMIGDDFDIEDGDDVRDVPLPNVGTAALAKIVAFCELHAEEPMKAIPKPLLSTDMAEAVQPRYVEFLRMDNASLLELIVAANFMDVGPLLELACASVASQLKGKTPEENRAAFGIVNDFTPEEEAEVWAQNKWCGEE